MAVSRTNLATGYGNAPSWTVPSGANFLIVLNSGIWTTAPSALTWDGDSLTKGAHPDGGTFMDCSLWYLLDPSTGLFTLGGTGLSSSHVWYAWSCSGVDGTTPVGTGRTVVYNGADPDDNPLQYTAPPGSDDIAFGGFGDLGNSRTAFTPFGDCVEDAEHVPEANSYQVAGHADGDGTNLDIGWSGDAEEYGEGAGFNVIAAAVAADPVAEILSRRHDYRKLTPGPF